MNSVSAADQAVSDANDLAPQLPLEALPRSSAAAIVLATLAVIAALWWGQRFLVPLVAGVMLAMLLMPAAARLQVLLRSRVAASAVALLLALTTLVGAALAFGGQLVRVAERGPEMISLVAQQLATRDPDADSLLTRARDAMAELDRAAEQLAGRKAVLRPLVPGRSVVATKAANANAAVVAAAPSTGTFSDGATVALRETAVTGSSVLLKFAGDMTIILFIAFFVLSGSSVLTKRLLDQWGYHPQARQRAHQALLECARQIRIYAVVLLITNSVVGVVVWLAFMVGGLPDAAGWGVTAAVLHVVPYLGMALLTALGAAEAFLAHGTVGAALGMAAFLVLFSTVIGTLVTAWLQGRAAKMNSAAVFIGLVFWGALWGVWGLFLGPALVVLFKVIAENSRSGRQLALLMQG